MHFHLHENCIVLSLAHVLFLLTTNTCIFLPLFDCIHQENIRICVTNVAVDVSLLFLPSFLIKDIAGVPQG